jgi:hypothetical protein
LKVFEILATAMPSVQQELGRINTDIATVGQSIKNVVDGINKKTKDLAEMDNMVITRLMGLEQSYGSLAKTLGAIVSTLSDAGTLDQSSVMLRLRKSDEAADKARTDQMVQLKVLKESQEVQSDSFIVVSQTFTNKLGAVDVVSEYRSMEFGSPTIDEETKSQYVGKTVNDVVELNLDDGVLQTKILQIYSYVQVYAEGQTEQTPENKESAAESAQ